MQNRNCPIHVNLVLFISIIVTLFFGCTHYRGDGAMTTIIATSEAFKAFDGEYENTEYFKQHKPESIAVLPFSSLDEKPFALASEFEQPESVVRRGLYNHISSLPFKDLEIFQTDLRLKNAGLSDLDRVYSLITDDPQKLRSILGVDAVVTGDVTHFDRYYVGVYSQVAVGCEVKMWDLESGHLLWRAKHVSRAHAGGLSLNPLGMLLSAAASVWNMRDTEMLSQTDEVFREIVSTIDMPEDALITKQPPPRIDLFSAMGVDKPVTAGQEIHFRLVGDPGCKAYVDLGDYKRTIPLEPVSSQSRQKITRDVFESLQERYRTSGQELSPELQSNIQERLASREIYAGSYEISPGEEMYGLTSKGYIVNPLGDQGTRIDIANTIDIDAKPPQITKNLTLEPLNRKVKLSWEPNSEKDLKFYQIWTSLSPLSGYEFAMQTESTQAILENIPNFDPVYVKVRALDRADNKGTFSHHAAATPVPKTGLYNLPQPESTLGGTFDSSALLVRHKSPYRAATDIIISNDATLYAEPGVEVRFSPDTALIVSGGSFVTYGQKSRPVKLIPSSMQAGPGSWKGLYLNGAKQVYLRYTTISNAATGIGIKNSSPEIHAAIIKGCSQAGLHLQSNARPNISCSTLSDNIGQGALVIEGQGVAPLIRNCIFKNNMPFHVQSYAPSMIDLGENFWGKPTPEEDQFLGDIVLEPVLTAPVDCFDK